MHRKLYLLIITAVSVMLLSSCKKEGHDRHDDESKAVTLNVTINAGETYQLNLGQYGDEDDQATITKQAGSYSTSEITGNSMETYVYNFSKPGSPKTGGNGTEQVILKVYEPEGRCRNHDEETSITINFTIL